HDGGIKIDLANETTGQHLCTSYAGYGDKPAYMGNIDSMTTCSWDRLGTVRKGEVLSIDTFYDPPAPQSDVMGIVLAYVYETDDLAGGTPPPPGPRPAACPTATATATTTCTTTSSPSRIPPRASTTGRAEGPGRARTTTGRAPAQGRRRPRHGGGLGSPAM